jgi:signal transduction histidine kinase
MPALLLVALGVTGIVTLQAYKASRQHRAVAEQVLNGYVSFVAQNLKTSVQESLYTCAEFWLYPALSNEADAMDKLRTDDACRSADGGRFDLDLRASRVHASRALSEPQLAWLLDTIPGNVEEQYSRQWHIGALIATVNGRSELISYALHKDGGVESRAVGFVAAGALQRIIDLALDQVSLPPELGVNARLRDYFAVANNFVASKAAQGPPSSFTQTRALNESFGGITLTVSLLEPGLRALAPDGLPPNRGWEFLGLFALAVGLVLSSLLLLRREAELARTRANFVSGVSHELRTPLAQIRLFAEMLLLGRVRSEADRRRSLEVIDTEARRLSQLVENVLQVARSENGHLHVNPTTMAVAPIIRECVESFSVLAQARSIQFRQELQPDLVAPVDSAALRQIVLNLLDNAAKYGPDGQRVVIGAALYDNTAHVWVDDEGPGIPPRERQRVFDPFYRVHAAQQTTGSGIGLAVVRELVALHGGDAWIDEAPDGGTRVVVQFPGAYVSAEQATGDFAVA